MSRQSRSKAQARLKAKRAGSSRRARSAEPELGEGFRAEAEAADRQIRELVARQRELEVPIRAKLDPMVAAAAGIEKSLELLGQASALSLSPDGQEVCRAIFRHLVGGAWILREFSAFDTGPEERAIVDDLVRRLEEEEQDAREHELLEQRARASEMAAPDGG
jgi:hypothetical protein